MKIIALIALIGVWVISMAQDTPPVQFVNYAGVVPKAFTIILTPGFSGDIKAVNGGVAVKVSDREIQCVIPDNLPFGEFVVEGIDSVTGQNFSATFKGAPGGATFGPNGQIVPAEDPGNCDSEEDAPYVDIDPYTTTHCTVSTTISAGYQMPINANFDITIVVVNPEDTTVGTATSAVSALTAPRNRNWGPKPKICKLKPKTMPPPEPCDRIPGSPWTIESDKEIVRSNIKKQEVQADIIDLTVDEKFQAWYLAQVGVSLELKSHFHLEGTVTITYYRAIKHVDYWTCWNAKWYLTEEDRCDKDGFAKNYQPALLNEYHENNPTVITWITDWMCVPVKAPNK